MVQDGTGGETGDAALTEALQNTSVIIPVKDDIRVAACMESIDEPVEVEGRQRPPDPERARGLAVYDELEPCRHLHG